MNMHGRIMNLQVPQDYDNIESAWRVGFQNARHAAAEIAAEGDALVEKLAKVLEDLLDTGYTGGPQGKRARAALAKVRG